MEANGDNNIAWFNYTGEEDISDDATHVFIRVGVVPAAAFSDHPNITELVCHEDVEKIEVYAFERCPSLRRVIMLGVGVVEDGAFQNCDALITDAFRDCKSLRSIDLTSAAVVESRAFSGCEDLRDAKFSDKLETLEEGAFHKCTKLERITIPLKDGMITETDIFAECVNLNYVDLVEGEVHETIAALHLEEWRNDMNRQIDLVNQFLHSIKGRESEFNVHKTVVIQTWISLTLRQITCYQADHQLLLNEAATTLQLALPDDIVTNNVLSFLELPSYSFEWTEIEDELAEIEARRAELEEEEEADESEEEEELGNGIMNRADESEEEE